MFTVAVLSRFEEQRAPRRFAAPVMSRRNNICSECLAQFRLTLGIRKFNATVNSII